MALLLLEAFRVRMAPRSGARTRHPPFDQLSGLEANRFSPRFSERNLDTS